MRSVVMLLLSQCVVLVSGCSLPRCDINVHCHPDERGRLVCGAGLTCRPGPGGAVPANDIVQVPPDYHRSPSVLDRLIGIAESGAEMAGVGSACAPVCVPAPDSPECERCRIDVASGDVLGVMSNCAGSAYVLPPDRITVVLQATTDSGTYESPPINAYKRSGTVRYDECGSANNADYVFDQDRTNDFVHFVGTRSRRFISGSVRQVDTGGPLIGLTDDAKALIQAGKIDQLGAGATQIGFSVWGFAGGGADPILGIDAPDGVVLADGTLLGEQLSGLANGGGFSLGGQARFQLKPCRSDSDCDGGLACRPSVDRGLVCRAP